MLDDQRPDLEFHPGDGSGGLHGAGADGRHNDVCNFPGVESDDVGGTLDLGHRRAHAFGAEPMNAGINASVRGRQHRPDRAAGPRLRRRRLGERDTGERALDFA